jgi:hypothetical protein
VVEQAFGLREQRPARSGQAAHAIAPMEQLRSDAFLKLFDLRGERGLREVQFTSRTGKVHFVSHRDKRAKRSQFERHPRRWIIESGLLGNLTFRTV